MERLSKLLEVKSIITLSLVFAAIFGFFNGSITGELFGSWVAMVLTYFFVRRTDKQPPNDI